MLLASEDIKQKQNERTNANLLTNEKYLGFLERDKKSGEWTISRKKKNDMAERGLGRKTREEIAKGNQMTTPGFQTGERR